MSPFENPSERFRTTLWVAAIVFFGVGDLTTTAIGLGVAGVVEAGPVVGPVIDRYGVAGIGLVKTLVFAGSYGLWRAVPAPHRLGVPLGLAVVGVGVTGWNSLVVAVALVG